MLHHKYITLFSPGCWKYNFSNSIFKLAVSLTLYLNVNPTRIQVAHKSEEIIVTYIPGAVVGWLVGRRREQNWFELTTTMVRTLDRKFRQPARHFLLLFQHPLLTIYVMSGLVAFPPSIITIMSYPSFLPSFLLFLFVLFQWLLLPGLVKLQIRQLPPSPSFRIFFRKSGQFVLLTMRLWYFCW